MGALDGEAGWAVVDWVKFMRLTFTLGVQEAGRQSWTRLNLLQQLCSDTGNKLEGAADTSHA